jgi:FMN phosphatase YigB (HAD superfamily)
MSKPIAIVDVDETLWAFHDAVFATGSEMGVRIPKRRECTGWEAIYKYSGQDQVIEVFNRVHSHQCSYNPYPYAEQFLKFMKSKFHVIIASHRKDEYRAELVEWLKIHDLVYDEVVVSSDKTSMFDNPRVAVVVDDRADTINAALAKNKIGVGLRKPWNTCSEYSSMTLFDNLEDIQDFLECYQKTFTTWSGHGSETTTEFV